MKLGVQRLAFSTLPCIVTRSVKEVKGAFLEVFIAF